jgi:CheY-like chemotaxis protein
MRNGTPYDKRHLVGAGILAFEGALHMLELVELARIAQPRRRAAALAMRGIGARREGTPATLMIVEDDAIMAVVMREELVGSGYDVVAHADNGAEAVDLAERHRPDLVILDVRLRGEMDGIATAREIRRRVATRIVFVTAHVDPETRKAMAATGCDGLVAKPYTPAQLARAVEDALAR